jgi:hypothetical protein
MTYLKKFSKVLPPTKNLRFANVKALVRCRDRHPFNIQSNLRQQPSEL